MKFDALEDIIKARKPKGLGKWKKLEHVWDKLEGKTAKDITFTTCYPGQEGDVKQLGSSEGNLHFLLGYVNPSFHLAPYHFQIVDPNLTDDEAAKKGHPSNPRYWEESGLPLEDEGDLEEGVPHPFSMSSPTAEARLALKRSGSKRVTAGHSDYVISPDQTVVYSMTTGHSFSSAVVEGSRFFYEHIKDSGDTVSKSLHSRIRMERYHHDVYPFIKSMCPTPGAVFRVHDDLFAVVRPSHIEFLDKKADPTTVTVFDREYSEFDLTKGGDVHPSILVNFVEKYMKVPVGDYEDFI